MVDQLTRRNVLKGMAAGATVLGWSPVRGAWVPAGASTTHRDRVAQVPPLDGTLETTPEAIGAFSGDFGRLVSAAPMAVLRPGSVRDISKMVRYARQNRLTVAMNGQSGSGEPGGTPHESHSQYGQATAPGGIAIDARRLSAIHHIGRGYADVDAGVTWAEIGDAALESGQTPPVLTDFLPLSVGGTLSVGGFGGTSHRYGTQADNVRELTVVTGTGDVVTCSRGRRRSLFDSVLAGGGQCGLIVRATVDLVAAPTHVTVTTLVYEDLETYLSDSARVMGEGRASHQSGDIARRPDDSGWRYSMELGVYHSLPQQPDQGQLLRGLRDNRAEANTFTLPFPAWAHRLDEPMSMLLANGFWEQPHPWLSLFVPRSKAGDFVRSVVAELQPEHLGAGFAGLFPLATSKLQRPLMAMPDESVVFSLFLLRFPFPGYPDTAGLVEQNRRLYDRAVALGGKRYLIGAVPDMSSTDWRRHYGRAWPGFAVAKRLHDPGTVLTPGQGIFG
jgi:cytokinin dehydrogenase